MADKTEIIRLAAALHLSGRSIYRRTGTNRRTIAKILKEYNESLIAQENDPDAVSEYLIRKPSYTNSSRPKRKLTNEMTVIIDDCLRNNEIKNRSGRRKQLMMRMDIYDLVRTKDHDISYSTVCRYIQSKSSIKTGECFIKQRYEAGYGTEFDWGTVKLTIAGEPCKFLMAVFTMSHSNARWGYLYQHEDTLAFMESHVHFFRYLQGIPQEVVYDNMKVAVARFIGGKEPTEALKRMMVFYSFRHRFCNVRRGNEKGHVERSVEVLRRKAFSFKDSFTSLEEANNYLQTTYIDLNNKPAVKTLFDVEKTKLQPYLGDMGCFELVTLKVDKQATFCFKRSHYSVPEQLINQLVDVKIYSEKLKVYKDKQLLCIHERCYSQKWILKLDHYLNTLVMKPGAMKGAVAFKQVPEALQQVYYTYFSKDSRSFIELLRYAKDRNIDYTQIIAATHRAEELGVSLISTDHVRQILENKLKKVEPIKDQVTDQIGRSAKQQLLMLTQLMNNKTTEVYGSNQ